jgi:hypothetical protein
MARFTDAVTQSNITVLGDAPAQATGSLYQTAANSTGLAMQNAVAAQQHMNVLAAAVVTRCVATLTWHSSVPAIEQANGSK